MGDEGGGGFGVAFRRPLLGGAAGGAGNDGDPRPGQRGQFYAHVFARVRRSGQPGRSEGPAGFAGEKQIEIFEDLMGAAGPGGGGPDVGEHQVARKMAGKADAAGNLGEERRDGGTERVGQNI